MPSPYQATVSSIVSSIQSIEAISLFLQDSWPTLRKLSDRIVKVKSTFADLLKFVKEHPNLEFQEEKVDGLRRAKLGIEQAASFITNTIQECNQQPYRLLRRGCQSFAQHSRELSELSENLRSSFVALGFDGVDSESTIAEENQEATRRLLQQAITCAGKDVAESFRVITSLNEIWSNIQGLVQENSLHLNNLENDMLNLTSQAQLALIPIAIKSGALSEEQILAALRQDLESNSYENFTSTAREIISTANESTVLTLLQMIGNICQENRAQVRMFAELSWDELIVNLISKYHASNEAIAIQGIQTISHFLGGSYEQGGRLAEAGAIEVMQSILRQYRETHEQLEKDIVGIFGWLCDGPEAVFIAFERCNIANDFLLELHRNRHCEVAERMSMGLRQLVSRSTPKQQVIESEHFHLLIESFRFLLERRQNGDDDDDDDYFGYNDPYQGKQWAIVRDLCQVFAHLGSVEASRRALIQHNVCDAILACMARFSDWRIADNYYWAIQYIAMDPEARAQFGTDDGIRLFVGNYYSGPTYAPRARESLSVDPTIRDKINDAF